MQLAGNVVGKTGDAPLECFDYAAPEAKKLAVTLIQRYPRCFNGAKMNPVACEGRLPKACWSSDQREFTSDAFIEAIH
ncbi:hypothetical protein J23TS9_29470 [Paenibacillus sp. J23TS9]|nr:hypothetical protein J23TS9_29470 [Paenibacillus sp. J23TS9]